MKDYKITVNRPVYENVLTFKTKKDAYDFAAKKRRELAGDLKLDWMDLWFDVEDYESKDEE
jgi:hypothetical protein